MTTLTIDDVVKIVQLLHIDDRAVKSGCQLYDIIVKNVKGYLSAQYARGKTDGVKVLYNKLFAPFKGRLKLPRAMTGKNMGGFFSMAASDRLVGR